MMITQWRDNDAMTIKTIFSLLNSETTWLSLLSILTDFFFNLYGEISLQDRGRPNVDRAPTILRDN